MALIQSTAIPSGATDYELEQSLRFSEDRVTYLEKTFASAGNRKTWTWSGWVKRGKFTGDREVFFGGGTTQNDTDWLEFGWNSTNTFYCTTNSAATYSSALFRDTGSWYHILFVADTTQSTATNRFKLYVNGVDQSLGELTSVGHNANAGINGTEKHYVGNSPATTGRELDGYLSEVNFIDGLAKAPADFGETGDYGEWKPIEYSGTYGTNGFYLPFKQDYTVEGFSTVTYKGTAANHFIGGVGFSPDFIWTKSRSTAGKQHILVDAIRGGDKNLMSDSNEAENSSANRKLTLGAADGYVIDSNSGHLNESDKTYVAWNWDMGGSNATNTDGSITSTVRANPTYGQSIVSYTGISGASKTIGHGLSSAPEMIIVKNRGLNDEWVVYNHSIGNEKYLRLDSTVALADEIYWNDTTPTDALFSVGNHRIVNSGSYTYIAYCFHSVTGYSKIGSYSGTDSAGVSVTTGFKPAFVMIKATNIAENWVIIDNTRNPNNPANSYLNPNLSSAEGSSSAFDINFTDTGFTLNGTDDAINGYNGGTGNYIYMAFADKREYAYWLDQSGNNNDWTSNNLTESDVMVDSPTNNFATINPLSKMNNGAVTLSEGNLQFNLADNGMARSSILASSGKWYWEAHLIFTDGSNLASIGVSETGYMAGAPFDNGAAFNGYVYINNGTKNSSFGNASSYGTSYAVGDIIGVALDLDNGTLAFYKNNVSQGTAFTGVDREYGAYWSGYGNTDRWVANFGQDSSFAGNKTAQGNQDGNDIGDFYYTPPTGFLALCTKNLPDVAVVPSEHFNTITYTGNNGASAITGVGFQPDFAWFKARNLTEGHMLFDAVRGAAKTLFSNTSGAENTSYTNVLSAFNTDGYTLGSNEGVNHSSGNYVAWNWKANGSGSSNTNGSSNSTVSANTDAGFSIVSYTGQAGAQTIGHGLSKTPEVVLVKNRSDADEWLMYHHSLTDAKDKYLRLDGIGAVADNTFWNDTAPTNEVFSVGDNRPTNSGHGSNYIAYCFHSVDGYSKVGSYTGNGSTDGTFVYTGFRPAWVMWKKTNASGTMWQIFDNARNTFNVMDKYLAANDSAVEGDYDFVDFTSNGFKHRHLSGHANGSGDTYIYLCFSETPFKYSNAR